MTQTEKLATHYNVDHRRLLDALGITAPHITRLAFDVSAGDHGRRDGAYMLVTVEQYITKEQYAALCEELEDNPPKEIK
jgi:hypothetical protein